MRTAFIHPSLRIPHTFNPFHVYMYISRWGSERQSPSLEIIFDLVLTRTGICPLSCRNPCPYDEGVGNQSANALPRAYSLSPLLKCSLSSIIQPTPTDSTT